MINLASIIDGFKVLLGAVPIHIAMIATLLTAIHIPRDDNGTWFDFNDKALMIYLALLANHIFSLAIVLLTTTQHDRSQLLISQFSIIAICFMIVVILEVSSDWTFNEEINGQCFEDKKGKIFTLWTIIELLAFIA